MNRWALRRCCSILSALALSLDACGTAAQAQLELEPSDRRFWVGAGVLLAGSALLDEEIRAYAADHQREALDRLARAVDPLGRPRYLVPTMVGAFAVTRLAAGRRWSDAVLRIGAGYAVADAVGTALKIAVGRKRPDPSGNPWRFHSFSKWHSFPSGHTTHAFALAAGIAEEARRPWVSAVSYGAATLVGLQRIYTQQHWTSDVVASVAIAVAASKTTNRWLRAGGLCHLLAPEGLRVVVLPTAVLVSLPLAQRAPQLSGALAPD